MKKVAIQLPFMSKEEICENYRKIKPIVKIYGMPYFLREFSADELVENSYLENIQKDKSVPVNMLEYELIMENNTLHKFESLDLFSPNIGDIISQIPKDILDRVSAFEIIHIPNGWECSVFHNVEFQLGYHVSKVSLYSKKIK